MIDKWFNPEPTIPQSPHCQYLSLIIPDGVAGSSGLPLPVMVWIHGGGNDTGRGDLSTTDPSALVREQNVIVVVVNYRLGLLGFGGDDSNFPSNLGLHDLVCALEWVSRYIEYFGGDPDRVTVFGQSSGAEVVAALLAVTRVRPWFRRAILQSAPLGLPASTTRSRRCALGSVAGRSALPDIGSLGNDELLDLQRRVARRLSMSKQAALPFGILWDAEPLKPVNRSRTYSSDDFKDRDILIGTTSDETAIYLQTLPIPQVIIDAAMTSGFLRTVSRKFLVGPTTDKIFTKPALEFAAHAAQSARSVFTYELSWGPDPRSVGAVHMMDLPLIFGGVTAWSDQPLVSKRYGRKWSPGANRATSPATETAGVHVRTVWTQFARTGGLDERALSRPFLQLQRM